MKDIDSENFICEFCAERFKNILDLDAHQFNNRYCQETKKDPPGAHPFQGRLFEPGGKP